MKKILSLTVLLFLTTACAGQKVIEEQKPCSGSLIKGCTPVVYFDFNKSKLNSKDKVHLDWAVAKLKRWPKKNAVVAGYADMIGSQSHNQKLSQKRAETVQKYFIQKGIDPHRIVIEPHGKNDLLTENPANQNVNRRVEIRMFF